ncbi:MAG: hypothetical protein AAF733_06705, partial [Verrucomicrobiota bacterium]
MKAILTLALAAAALIGFTSEADANPHYRTGHVWGYSNHGHCGSIYKIRTIEICRRSECRTAYYPCGTPYRYHVTIVTYRDI